MMQGINFSSAEKHILGTPMDKSPMVGKYTNLPKQTEEWILVEVFSIMPLFGFGCQEWDFLEIIE
jgi:hypothetical protein